MLAYDPHSFYVQYVAFCGCHIGRVWVVGWYASDGGVGRRQRDPSSNSCTWDPGHSRKLLMNSKEHLGHDT